MSDAEKTEDPTPKRKREAREEGNVPKSSEFTGVVVMVTAIGVLVFWAANMAEQLAEATVHAIDVATRPDLDKDMLGPVLFDALKRVSWMLFPLLGATFVMAAFISFVQVGPLFTPQVLLPKAKKLNPIEGLKNILSKDKAVELAKNLLKIVLMGGIGTMVLTANIEPLLRVPRLNVTHGLQVFKTIALELGMYLVGGLFAFGAFDMWWQYRQWWEKLKMSKKEVEDEHKEQEGDPEVENKREEKHKELIEEAGQADDVKDADAVVVNPSHVAVALEYRRGEMDAPHVVATGRGERARKIKKLARRLQVPIVRDVQLARELFDCEADRPVPQDFYEPVAEILKFVYELDDETQR